jgi:hypothetical protein
MGRCVLLDVIAIKNVGEDDPVHPGQTESSALSENNICHPKMDSTNGTHKGSQVFSYIGRRGYIENLHKC